MRVALVTSSTRPRGGVVHTLALAEALAARGDQVTVYAVGRDGDRLFRSVAPGVDVRLATHGDAGDPAVAADVLATAVDTGAHDVVHAQDAVAARAVPRAVRTVHHVPSGGADDGPSEAATHVCTTHAVAGHLREAWGVEATVVPDGVDAARFAGAATMLPAAAAGRVAWRERLGHGLVALAVGGIAPRKGTLDLVAAMAVLVGRGRRVQLVVAGEAVPDDRAYRAEVDEACRRAGVAMTALGPVAHADLPALVATADAFVLPSTAASSGRAGLEAVAAGVPTVVADLPVRREVFGDAVRYGGDPEGTADAIADALERPGGDRGRRGRALATSRTWDATAEAHQALYATLASA